MNYILSWLLPLGSAMMIMGALTQEFPTYLTWHFQFPLIALLTLLYRDTLVSIFGVHVTYAVRIGDKDE